MRPLAVLAPAVAAAVVTASTGLGCAAARRGVDGRDGSSDTGGPVRAAGRAMGDPETWVPLAAGLLLQLGDADARISRWAADETPVFGSRADASRASDRLLHAAGVAHWASALLAGQGATEPEAWVGGRLERLVEGIAAVNVTGVTTDALKEMTARWRPEGSDRRSFPSGHTSRAAVHTTLARRSAGPAASRVHARTGLELSLAALALGTAWGRVEAGKHYPSDVLAGYALGHFLARFVDDAVSHPGGIRRVRVGVGAGRRGYYIGMRVAL